MKIAPIKSTFCKPSINKMTQTFKGESPSGGYYSSDWGESPCGGGYSSYSRGESYGGCSGCSSSDSGESPRAGRSSSPRRAGRRRRGESPSFGHKVNASYAINNPEKLLQTRLDFLKIQQTERAKRISKDKM